MESRSAVSWFDVQLPWPINYLPSIFRFLSLVYIAPVILLFLIDVGGYLLFKLFYKPFGNYPMYSYFKQAPPREEAESEPNSPGLIKRLKGLKSKGTTSQSTSSSSNASSCPTSPIIQPSISIDSNDLHSQDRQHASITKRHNSKKYIKGDEPVIHLDNVGFEGPMLGFNSPTASDNGP